MKAPLIYGYPERLSVKAGNAIEIMLSAIGCTRVRGTLVRLVHGDEHPDGPGFKEIGVAQVFDAEIAVSEQPVQKGNFLRMIDAAKLPRLPGSITIHAYVMPTMRGTRQVILAQEATPGGRGYVFGLTPEGKLQLATNLENETSLACSSRPLALNIWHFVTATIDGARGHIRISHRAVINRYNGQYSKIARIETNGEETVSARVHGLATLQAEVLVGGRMTGAMVGDCFSGKIDRIGIIGHALDDAEEGALSRGESAKAPVIAYWDTSVGYSDKGIGDRVVDTGPGKHDLIGVNRPVRGQTGWNWNGRNDSFRLAPQEYGGIEFHADALTDCAWAPSVSIRLPETLKSGAYALKLAGHGTPEGEEQYVVFFVRPARPSADICFLAPTASYLAYANGRSHMEGDVSQVILARVPVLQQSDLDGVENDCLFGLSTYDTHTDGAGVCYTSARRPMFTMHPKYRVPGVDCAWQFPADLSVIAFLEHFGYEFDVLTDEDLDKEGVDALLPYRLVINGTHCEYYTERMLDATEDYLAQGGNLTYLSGNGYYWVVAFRDDEPGVMEVRKLDAGSRAWQARPGECYLATTGERGGIWRLRGRAPQKLVGTGFASEGMDKSFPYQRLEGSRDPSLAWIFDGVENDIVGDFGLAHGGAVGLEIDRCDSKLGSPPNTVILASSGPLTENWQLVAEDVMFMYPGMGGDQHPLVRCDMAYFETQGGGAVFSPSSIAWGSALPVNNFDNDVSRIMKNVVDRLSRSQ